MFRQVVLINQGMEVAQKKEFTYMIMILLIEDRLYLSTYIVVSYATCDYFPYRAYLTDFCVNANYIPGKIMNINFVLFVDQ